MTNSVNISKAGIYERRTQNNQSLIFQKLCGEMTFLEISEIVIGPTFLIFSDVDQTYGNFNSIVKNEVEKYAPFCQSQN